MTRPCKRKISAETHKHDHEKIAEHVGKWHQHEGIGIGIHACRVDFLVAGAEPLDGRFAAAECLDDTLTADGFFHHAVDLAKFLLQIAKTFAGVARHKLCEPEHDRHNKQR